MNELQRKRYELMIERTRMVEAMQNKAREEQPAPESVPEPAPAPTTMQRLRAWLNW